jgi:hypothetical protein
MFIFANNTSSVIWLLALAPAALASTCGKESVITPRSTKAFQLRRTSSCIDDNTRAETIVDLPSYFAVKVTVPEHSNF